MEIKREYFYIHIGELTLDVDDLRNHFIGAFLTKHFTDAGITFTAEEAEKLKELMHVTSILDDDHYPASGKRWATEAAAAIDAFTPTK
jgi:hypothetical protein